MFSRVVVKVFQAVVCVECRAVCDGFDVSGGRYIVFSVHV